MNHGHSWKNGRCQNCGTPYIYPTISKCKGGAQVNWQYKGFTLTLNGASYSCPALKLWGYATPLQIERAVTRTLKKKETGQ